MKHGYRSRGILRAALIALPFAFGLAAQASDAKPTVAILRGDGAESNDILAPVRANGISQTVKRYTRTKLIGFAEYDANACTEISPGSWKVTQAPYEGEFSVAILNFKLGNGSCPGVIFTFAQLFYKWTPHNNKSLTDPPLASTDAPPAATWSTPDGNFNYPYTFMIDVPAVVPIGETTAFTNWTNAKGRWEQTLMPPASDAKFDFSGDSVTESSPSVGSDTCYFVHSAIMPQTSVSGGAWTIDMHNKWGSDAVGWDVRAVEYYRTHPLAVPGAPCGASVTQQMKFESQTEIGTAANYGGINQLSGQILTTQVTSSRGEGGVGQIYTETWP